ncbi:DUF3313 family protein [Cerasicoccus maritimus]|uniref:DUF3313 family protein n=1 Tax=Cerasicoccus maritimus TaxID=490089 RepID=UPI002852CC13|nr:DUF3313 family protein [Cerasicoccus maritimus]
MKTLLYFGVAFGAWALAGCSQQAVNSTPTGFVTTSLGDAGDFTIKDASALKGYDSVYLASVTAMPASGVTAENASDVEALEFAFEQAFKSQIGNVLQLADAPGEKTLTAKVAISQIISKAPDFNPMSNNPADISNSYGPGAGVGMNPDLMRRQLQVAGTSMFVDKVKTKVEFSNESGELLAQFADNDFGADIESDPTGGTSIPRVTEAFSAWCSEISAQLAQATGK